MSATGAHVDPITTRGHRRRARRRSPSRWATSWRACPTRRSSASPRTSAARSATTRRRQLCESTQSTPLQSGPIPGYVRGHQPRASPSVGDEWRPGDVVIHNHPYYGASHEPDVGVRHAGLPRRRAGRRSRVTTAHHLDLGALTPGTCGIVDATDAYAEGLQFNAVKVERGGAAQRVALAHAARQHPRCPSSSSATWRRRSRPCRLGARPLARARRALRAGDGRAASEELMDYSERMLRREIERAPRRHVPRERDARRLPRPPRSRPTTTCRSRSPSRSSGSDLHVDLTGHRAAGRPADQHAVRGHRRHRDLLTLRSILLDTATHEPCRRTRGSSARSRSSAPRGHASRTRFSRRRRSRGSARATSSPTRSCARSPRSCPDSGLAGRRQPQGRPRFSGLRDGTHWVHMDIMEGSYGGRLGKDGLDAVDTLYANTRNNPIEDIESHYPLRVTRYELAEGTGGRGPLARRPGLDPGDRVPRAGRRLARGRRQRRRRRRACSAAATAAPGAVTVQPGPGERALPTDAFRDGCGDVSARSPRRAGERPPPGARPALVRAESSAATATRRRARGLRRRARPAARDVPRRGRHPDERSEMRLLVINPNTTRR